MGKLTSVLIGCGAIAREHLAALASLKNVEVAAVCDLSAARAEATAERFRICKVVFQLSAIACSYSA